MKIYKINVTVKLTVTADTEDAMHNLLQEMNYVFTHSDSQSEIVKTEITGTEVVSAFCA